MSNTSDYYKEQKQHSRTKSEIVAAYLVPWAQILDRHCKDLYYRDLFSGPGEFDDGSKSTPLLMMDKLSEYPRLYRKLHIEFYEGDHERMKKLRKCVEEHPAYGELSHKPIFFEQKITPRIVGKLSQQPTSCTYTFIDPFGYKDISLDLLDLVASRWGCDCLFNLNISGLVRNLEQQEKRAGFKAFFGSSPLNSLFDRISRSGTESSKADTILDTISDVLREKRGYRLIHFCVEFEQSKNKNYYLVFMTKHPRGFEVMRDIMIARSIKDEHKLPLMMHSSVRESEQVQAKLDLTTQGDRLWELSQKVIGDFHSRDVLLKNLLGECLELCYPYQDAHIRTAIRYLLVEGSVVILEDERSSTRSRLPGTTRLRFRKK